MRRAFLDHLQDGVKHAHNGAERSIFVLGKATEAIEVAEKFVCAVDEMNDHEALLPRLCYPNSLADEMVASAEAKQLVERQGDYRA
jgi:hypothetical protein